MGYLRPRLVSQSQSAEGASPHSGFGLIPIKVESLSKRLNANSGSNKAPDSGHVGRRNARHDGPSLRRGVAVSGVGAAATEAHLPIGLIVRATSQARRSKRPANPGDPQLTPPQQSLVP